MTNVTNVGSVFRWLLAFLVVSIASSIASSSMAQNGIYLAKPSDITLKGSVRTEVLNTSLGKVNLRWPRALEVSFGRTPSRAMADASRTVSRALKASVFPSRLQSISQEWQVVFIGKELEAGEIPRELISNCHPGWMTPPANIYIVGDRIAAGCSSNAQRKSELLADSDLTGVVVHELGHAIEAILLTQGFQGDRMRAEGFATWFESYASNFSSYLNQRAIRKRNAELAERSFLTNPDDFLFQGSAFDYARASLYFSAIEEKYGLSGIIRLYNRMEKTGGKLMPAIMEEFHWSDKDLNGEVLKAIKKYK